jgi:hypothetical protein
MVGAPAAAWLNDLFGRAERARVAQPRNAQHGRRRRSAVGTAAGSAPAPVCAPCAPGMVPAA